MRRHLRSHSQWVIEQRFEPKQSGSQNMCSVLLCTVAFWERDIRDSLQSPSPFLLPSLPFPAVLSFGGSQHYRFMGPVLQPQPVHSTRTLQRGRDPDNPAQPCTDAGDSSTPCPIFSKPWKLCFLWAFLFLFASQLTWLNILFKLYIV